MFIYYLLCSWNATYDNLLGSNKPFPKPVPLPVSLPVQIGAAYFAFEKRNEFFLMLTASLEK
ncbi:hypothetical protein HanIR_Chr01g0050491 [Helianthus annuus]|nr:hypothetical protein HanIR_Chr01g0050491 [Helianthus annuus]